MPVQVLPKSLTTPEALQRLTRLLLKKEKLRRTLKARDFGPRVDSPEEATNLLARVMQISLEVSQMDDVPPAAPGLVLTRRLRKLPRQIAVLYLLLLPPSLFLFYLTLHHSERGAALWMVRGAILSLLVVPLLLYRRAKINIEHDCSYVRSSEGKAIIVIDQLPTAQFLSYLAHEYGHHLYFEQDCASEEDWRREGWARLLQWQVMQHLYHHENNPAYLYHVLIQITGELKFACELISRVLHHTLPRQVRFISTIYQRNPLLRLLTGTPGFNPARLIDHAVGTASYFLEAERSGPIEVLQRRPFESGQ